MSIFPDSGWLRALKLLSQVVFGLFLASATLLTIDYYEIIQLDQIHALATTTLIQILVIFGSISIAFAASFFTQGHLRRKKRSTLEQRRENCDDEVKKHQRAREEVALRRLDYLSKEEIHYISDCLRKNSQSFQASTHSSFISNMTAKRLIFTPGGAHHRDHYPYSFFDFVWEEILRRKDEFIEKDDAHKEADRQAKLKQALNR